MSLAKNHIAQASQLSKDKCLFLVFLVIVILLLELPSLMLSISHPLHNSQANKGVYDSLKILRSQVLVRGGLY